MPKSAIAGPSSNSIYRFKKNCHSAERPYHFALPAEMNECSASSVTSCHRMLSLFVDLADEFAIISHSGFHLRFPGD